MGRFDPLIFSFLLCPKSLKDRFLLPEFTKSSLKKVAKNGKIEASQKKEVLRWRRKKKSMRVNIYSHITDTMQRQAAVKIDREIGGTDAQMPEPELPKASEQAQTNATAEPKFEPYKGKIRKPGTGCVYQINDTLWEGSFYPRMPDGKRKKFNVYAETREQCEAKLAEMIAEKKAEIAEEKAKRKEGAD